MLTNKNLYFPFLEKTMTTFYSTIFIKCISMSYIGLKYNDLLVESDDVITALSRVSPQVRVERYESSALFYAFLRI